MRLFIAIEIPEDIKDYLVQIQNEIGHDSAKIRIVNKKQMHLTLKFLGEVQPDKVISIKEGLKEISFEPFAFHLDSIGLFPNENYIRIVWVGIKPEDKVLELQKTIDEKLSKLFKKEKDFKPHLTLGRVKYVEDKIKFAQNLRKIKIESKKIDVNDFKLIKSTLTPEGPVYEPITS